MNGWDRVPKTLRARCQVEDYLRRCPPRAPYVRVLRVARQLELLREQGVEWHQIRVQFGQGPSYAASVIREERLWDLDDVWNDAVALVHAREEARAHAPVPPSHERFTHELADDGSLRELATSQPPVYPATRDH